MRKGDSEFAVYPIGVVRNGEDGCFIELDKRYIPCVEGLDGFSHINVIWWFSGADDESSRSAFQERKPYKKSPDVLGTFATRSPRRPNPIAQTTAELIDIDAQNGVIRIAFIDADDGTPVLDIKPYTPSLDRVESPSVPAWCSHWPKNTDESADFAWEDEFNF